MTDEDRDLAAIESAAGTLVPELTRRLREHGLGEIEVHSGSLRLRVSGGAAPSGAGPGGASVTSTAPAAPGAPAAAPGDGTADREAKRDAVVSPAVGIVVFSDGLAAGHEVTAGQAIGHVDMLGVHYDVRARHAGRVATLATESGDPVEYGQLLLEIEQPPPK